MDSGRENISPRYIQLFKFLPFLKGEKEDFIKELQAKTGFDVRGIKIEKDRVAIRFGSVRPDSCVTIGKALKDSYNWNGRVYPLASVEWKLMKCEWVSLGFGFFFLLN